MEGSIDRSASLRVYVIHTARRKHTRARAVLLFARVRERRERGERERERERISRRSRKCAELAQCVGRIDRARLLSRADVDFAVIYIVVIIVVVVLVLVRHTHTRGQYIRTPLSPALSARRRTWIFRRGYIIEFGSDAEEELQIPQLDDARIKKARQLRMSWIIAKLSAI